MSCNNRRRMFFRLNKEQAQIIEKFKVKETLTSPAAIAKMEQHYKETQELF